MSIFRSFGSISISSSSSSASGNTMTPAAEVWMRPCDSVTGMRCTRCTPPSYLSDAHTPSSGDGFPLARMAICTSFTPPSSVEFSLWMVTPQPRFSAYRMYMRSRSPANNAASSPPAPALISMITSRASSGSRGMSAVRSFSSASGSSDSRRLASCAKSGSSPAISWAASRSFLMLSHVRYALTMVPSCACLRPSLRILSGFDQTSCSPIWRSMFSYSSNAVFAAGNSSLANLRLT